MMIRVKLSALALLGVLTASMVLQAAGPAYDQFRPPAVPLVTCNPYFSIWSFADRLTYDEARHWTGGEQGLHSMVRIDGTVYRVMGANPWGEEPMTQDFLRILPTRTIYDFAGAGVSVTLTFMTAFLPHDLETFSRPVTYLTWKIQATDGRPHDVQLYFDSTAELVVNTVNESVVWRRETMGPLAVLRMGTEAQPILKKSGDNVRIDWGYLYVATPAGTGVREVIASVGTVWKSFARSGKLPDHDDARMPRPVSDHMPVMACEWDLGRVGSAAVTRHLILAYDQIYSIEYFHQWLRPYWRRSGAQAGEKRRA